MTQPQFNIGDTAYVAQHSPHTDVWVQCPECLGTRTMRVILATGDEHTIDCACCERGYEGSPGKILTWQAQANVEAVVIAGVESHMDGETLKVRYHYSPNYIVDACNVFATHDEAMVRAEELSAAHNAEQAKRVRCKEKDTRKWAWNVSYHRKEIREAHRKIEYHTAKLNAAKEHVKGGA